MKESINRLTLQSVEALGVSTPEHIANIEQQLDNKSNKSVEYYQETVYSVGDVNNPNQQVFSYPENVDVRDVRYKETDANGTIGALPLTNADYVNDTMVRTITVTGFNLPDGSSIILKGRDYSISYNESASPQ